MGVLQLAANYSQSLGESDVSIVGATYNTLGRIEGAIGAKEANSLRVLPHQYVIDGITVHGVSRRGGWYTGGPALVAWATDQVLTEVERQHPPAIAAVADWPDDIAGWRSVYRASRIGQERHEQEAKFNTKVIADLDPQIG